MDQIQSALSRMRELAVQSANETYDSTTRGYIGNEFASLRDEIERISNVTDFNGKSLLSSSSRYTFWVGTGSASATNSISLSVVGTRIISLGGTAAASTVASANVATASAAVFALAVLDKAINKISAARGLIGAAQNRMTFAVDNLASVRENLSAANSRIRDVDVASESAAFSRNQILSQAGVSVLAQANQLPSVALSLLR